jgi:beta-phosphoglucomutase-like phosphatase (HAD superfamily)
MIEAVIFDVDGTLVDSVDLHARAWVEAFRDYGIAIKFEDMRRQIGKGGDQIVRMFLSDQQMANFGERLEQHTYRRSNPFPEAVPFLSTS